MDKPQYNLDLSDKKIFQKLLYVLLETLDLAQDQCDHYREQSKIVHDNMVLLADYFEVGYSTVARWRHGVANPHPRLRVLVINYLMNQIETDEII